MVVLYEKNATTFNDNGICILDPSMCVVTEVAGGQYELELEHPLDDYKKYLMITEERLIKAPVPVTVIPETVMPQLDILQVKSDRTTNLLSRVPTKKYSSGYGSIITKLNNSAELRDQYAWKQAQWYNTGSIVLFSGTVYKANKGNIGVQPGTNFFVWKSIGKLSDGNPTIDSSTIIATLAASTKIVKISDVDGSYIRVRVKDGDHQGKFGFVLKDDCNTTQDHEQQIIPQQTITEQVFRVYETECDEESQTYVVRAKHISYDFARNCLYECKLTNAKPYEAIANIQAALMEDDQRTIACNIEEGKISKDWSFKNPVNALLDPDNGLLNTLKARLVRNNGEFYILDYTTPNQGITLEYGVNLVGVQWTRSFENVVTRVLPRSGTSDKGYTYISHGGKIVNGEVQDEGKPYVESEIADQYASPIISVLNCSYQIDQKYKEADGTEKTYDEATVLAKMLEDATNKFIKDVVDGPEITLDVEFLLLGDTEEYKQYRGLQKVNLYDVVKVKTGKSGIVASAKVTEYEYDCLRKRYNSIKLGKVNSFARRVPGYRMVNESVTYEKLSPDLINRILTENASATDDGVGGSSETGDGMNLTTAVDMNSKDKDGIVEKGSGHANKVWKTDANGNPDWRTESGAGFSVVDNLTSTSATDALSAKQGNVLNTDKLSKNKVTTDQVTDCNSMTTTGIYSYQGSTTNAPTTGGGVLICFFYWINQGVQIATTNNEEFLSVRFCKAGTFTSWKTFSLTT